MLPPLAHIAGQCHDKCRVRIPRNLTACADSLYLCGLSSGNFGGLNRTKLVGFDNAMVCVRLEGRPARAGKRIIDTAWVPRARIVMSMRSNCSRIFGQN